MNDEEVLDDCVSKVRDSFKLDKDADKVNEKKKTVTVANADAAEKLAEEGLVLHSEWAHNVCSDMAHAFLAYSAKKKELSMKLDKEVDSTDFCRNYGAAVQKRLKAKESPDSSSKKAEELGVV